MQKPITQHCRMTPTSTVEPIVLSVSRKLTRKSRAAFRTKKHMKKSYEALPESATLEMTTDKTLTIKVAGQGTII